MTEDQNQDSERQREQAEDRRRREDGQTEKESTPADRGETVAERPETEERGRKGEGMLDAVQYSPQDVQIPVIEVDERVKEAEIVIEDTEPVVEVSDEGSMIPDVALGEATIETRSVDMIVEEPDVARETIESDVPIVKLEGPPSIRLQHSSFITTVPKRPTTERHRVRIPLFRKASKPQVRSISEFDTTIESELRRRIEHYQTVEETNQAEADEEAAEEATAKVETETEASPISVPPSGIGDIDVEELPDPFELIFSGGGEVDSGKPLVIGLDDQNGTHMGVLRTLCQRVYREKEGGTPEPLILRDLDELTGGDQSTGEIRWMEAEDSVFSVQLDENEWDTLLEEEEMAWERIWNRIDQLFSQGFGVLLFNKMLHRVPTEQEHLIQTIALEPQPLSSRVYRDIAQLCWGYVDVSESPNFNMVFDYARELSERRLKEVGTVEGGIFRDAVQEHDGFESSLHLHMKWFVVRHLVTRLREQGVELETPMQIEETVQTEIPVPGGTSDETPVADVKQGSEVFEVETLFAEARGGSEPRNKLRKSFMKYDGTGVDVVHIVLDNLTFHRHLKDIIQLKRHHKDWENQQEIDIRFETIDLREGELIELVEAISRLKQIVEQIEQ